jgi:DNA-binding transcriptional MerR regulator
MRSRELPLPGLNDELSGYRGPQVAKIVGISYRQLDHWTTTGLVTPSVQESDGSGTQRLYSFDDIVQLRVIRRLRNAGASLQKIAKVIEALRDRGLALGADVTLMTDGSSVFVCDSQDQVMDLLMSGQGVFGIAIDPIRQQTEADVITLEPLRPADATGPIRRAI